MNLLLCPRLFPHSLLLSPDFLFYLRFCVLLLLKFHSLSHLFLACRGFISRKSISFMLFYLNKSECEPVLTRDNTKTSSIFSYINKKSGSI